MAQGTRSDWAVRLPLIQAYVEGKPLQELGYDKRWKPSENLRDLLCNFEKFRIAPDGWTMGIWSIEYDQKFSPNLDGPTSRGMMHWKGASTDTPPWPQDKNITYDMKTEEFMTVGPLDDRCGGGFDD